MAADQYVLGALTVSAVSSRASCTYCQRLHPVTRRHLRHWLHHTLSVNA